MGYGLIQLRLNLDEVPRSPDQYAHGFSLAVGFSVTEPGFFSGDFTGFLAGRSLCKILHKLTLHMILITPAPITEFRLDRQAERKRIYQAQNEKPEVRIFRTSGFRRRPAQSIEVQFFKEGQVSAAD